MAEVARYTEEMMQSDMKRDFEFMTYLMKSEVNRMRQKMENNLFKVSYMNWSEGYQDLMELSRRFGRDTSRLQAALDCVKDSLDNLKLIAESDLLGLQLSMDEKLKSLEDVR